MSRHQQSTASKDILLYGHHPVSLALQNPKRTILELYYTKGSLSGLTVPNTLLAKQVTKDFLDSLVGKDALHQGLVARCKALPNLSLEELLLQLNQKEISSVILLDQVTDPHNIGAILRSAIAFDADAVILPEAGAPTETGTLAKSASGALELIPMVRVSNLVRAMEKLKENGFWCIGMDGYASSCIADQKLPSKSAFVMGSEGNGMRRLTQQNCDMTTKLPINPAIESLNVSNAAALTLYEFRRQHPLR